MWYLHISLASIHPKIYARYRGKIFGASGWLRISSSRDALLTSLVLQEQAKKRTRRTVKQQRGIVGAPLELIKDRRSQRPEAREAARKEAIAKGKEKKATAESKKKQEKAKSAAGAARGQPGRIQSKMGSKGVPSKASGKTR